MDMLKDFDVGAVKNVNFGNTWNMSMIIKYSQIFNYFQNNLKKNRNKILDVGCSVGNLLRFYHDHYMQPSRRTPKYLGVDASEKYISEANRWLETKRGKKREWSQFICDSIECQNFWSKVQTKFDMICMLEVIEHLSPENIEFVLNNISERMNNSSIFVISTPVHYSDNEILLRPDMHEWEYVYDDLIKQLNKNFVVKFEFGTSFNTAEFKSRLKEMPEYKNLYNEMKRKYIPFQVLIPIFDNVICDQPTNLTLICKRRNKK